MPEGERVKGPRGGLAHLRERRSVVTVLVASILASAIAAVTHPLLGQFALVLGAVVAVGGGYSMATLPRRSLERSAVRQARESPSLAAAAAVYLGSTGSKCKTVLMLDSEEPRLAALLTEMRRTTLLGVDPGDAFAEAGGRAASDSVSRILASVTRAQGDRLSEEGEELEGMVAAASSREETKFPVFLAISFFLPIMLMLLAALGHHTGPVAMVSLAFLEVVILDIALSLSSTERSRLSP